jgi:protein-disulfide isomerase-like protein with CxxC motif
MAVLSEAKRAEIWAEFQREVSSERETMPFTKAQLRAAVDAADSWVDSNAAAYNSALPAAFRSAATTAQKARLMMFVARKRFVEGA